MQGLAGRLAGTDTTIDVLINNAGIAERDALGALDYDAIRRQLEVNTLGPLRVTEALLERLKPGATVAFITSRIGSLGDNQSGGLYGYRISKCAANMVAVNLAHDLAKRGIAAVVLHPGMVATAMTFDDERQRSPPAGGRCRRPDRADRSRRADRARRSARLLARARAHDHPVVRTGKPVFKLREVPRLRGRRLQAPPRAKASTALSAASAASSCSGSAPQ